MKINLFPIKTVQFKTFLMLLAFALLLPFGVQSQDKKAKAGDPINFLGMVRSINPSAAVTPKISALNIDIAASVPRRR